ncbi:uncharacterized protein JCM6883_005572 [Sporobolomyces salmoneus]|uniref:uncharacterized protein n=1 Tax=Sporobolomyces salmoneus TaxID=183962 RepID=UPI00317F271A
MTSEADPDIVEGISESLQATTLSDKVETAHLSGLPGELLDDIFELAAATSSWDSKLTSHPISKALLPSQERAIYHAITVDSGARNFCGLVHSLDACPDNGRHTRRLVWSLAIYWDAGPVSKRFLSRLPNLIEIDFHQSIAANAQAFLQHSQLLSSLRICRLSGLPLTSSIVSCLSRIPTLRLVEVSSLPNKEEEKTEWSPARQVLQIAVHEPNYFFAGQDPSTLLRFFPAASIFSLDVHVDKYQPISPLLNILDPGLLLLRLKMQSISECDKSMSHLLNLPNLTSLRLAYHRQYPELQELLAKLDHLPRLRTLDLEYRGLDTGRKFDFEDAEEEYDYPEDSEGASLSLLQGATNPAQMEGWNSPWYERISDCLHRTIETENKARAAGLVVRSNLSSLIRILESRIVEYYNRAVGDFYFYDRKEPLRYALSLVDEHGLDIDRIEIDIDDDFDWEDLEWFEQEVEIDCGEWRFKFTIYGLRMRTESEGEENDKDSDGRFGQGEVRLDDGRT